MSASIARPFLLIKSALREPIWLAATVSTALHVGAIAWIISPDPAPREIKVAGGQVAIEVTLVEGPERHAGADSGDDRGRRSPGAAPARAAAQPDRVKTADRVPHRMMDRAIDRTTDPVMIPDETAFSEEPAPTTQTAKSPMAAAPSESSALAIFQAPPPPPTKPSPPDPTPVALPPVQQALPRPQTDAADGTDAHSTPAADGVPARAEPAAHRGGTQGAAPRGDNPKPIYPFVARKNGYQGRVILRVDVLPDGTAASVELTSSSGYDSLDAAAVRSVRQWRFVPARRNGVPVAAAVAVPVLFKLH